MQYADILRHFQPSGCFELPELVVLTQEKRATLLHTLCRWAKRGWITQVRRGLYAFPDEVAKNPLTAERAANHIYKDTYVTGLWRLNQLGLIPEGVTEVTNATRKNPAVFNTPLGRFNYRHIGVKGFWGYEIAMEGGAEVKIATPEKALLDFFWWQGGEWDIREFERWRIQDPFTKINYRCLIENARRWGQPRLMRAADRLVEFLAAAQHPL